MNPSARLACAGAEIAGERQLFRNDSRCASRVAVRAFWGNAQFCNPRPTRVRALFPLADAPASRQVGARCARRVPHDARSQLRGSIHLAWFLAIGDGCCVRSPYSRASCRVHAIVAGTKRGL